MKTSEIIGLCVGVAALGVGIYVLVDNSKKKDEKQIIINNAPPAGSGGTDNPFEDLISGIGGIIGLLK